MGASKAKRTEQLLKDFPALVHVRDGWKWSSGKRWRWPIMHIQVQRADPEMNHLQARDLDYFGRGYVMGNNGQRGTREEYMVAVNHNKRIIDTLSWEKGEYNKFAKDIFKTVNPDEVSYLIWVSGIEWFCPPTKEQQEKDICFGERKTGAEVHAIVYRKNYNLSFAELIEVADKLKKEREEAWKYPPKDMPELNGIHRALQNGCRLHAFASGGGLRVIRIEKNGKLAGYGEQPHVEVALLHADEDYLAGCSEYKEVYGKKYPHYLTGDTLSTSNLDWWVRKGCTFDCWQEGSEIVFELRGYAENKNPEWVLNKAKETDEPVQWQERGFTYATQYYEHNGDPGYQTEVVVSRPGAGNAAPWIYKIVKHGAGKNFWEAMTSAFAADEIEVEEE